MPLIGYDHEGTEGEKGDLGVGVILVIIRLGSTCWDIEIVAPVYWALGSCCEEIVKEESSVFKRF